MLKSPKCRMVLLLLTQPMNDRHSQSSTRVKPVMRMVMATERIQVVMRLIAMMPPRDQPSSD